MKRLALAFLLGAVIGPAVVIVGTFVYIARALDESLDGRDDEDWSAWELELETE